MKISISVSNLIYTIGQGPWVGKRDILGSLDTNHSIVQPLLSIWVLKRYLKITSESCDTFSSS